jgi:phosphoglycerate dehydrogenase-like enzyme
MLMNVRKRNVVIGWTGGTNKLSVAEMALGFMLMLARNLFISSNELKNGIWNKSAGFQLSEKTVGIIGLGNIGKELVRLLKPFNCKILQMI